MAGYLAANGTPPDRIRVLEPPLPDQGPIAERSSGVPTLTYTGRLVDFKGPDQLIRASSLLEFDHRVAIVGAGPAMRALRRLAADCGVAARVDFHGALAPAELDRIRRRSAAIVVPSLWPEVYGMVGAEALALGVPVVGTGIGGSAEWLALGGPLATTVDALDVAALARTLTGLVADPPSDAERRAVAIAVRRSLASKRHGERLAAIYHEAIAAASAETLPGPARAGAAVEGSVLDNTA
jgi:glycosyltransferase involved in cell wall biosynthesis